MKNFFSSAARQLAEKAMPEVMAEIYMAQAVIFQNPQGAERLFALAERSELPVLAEIIVSAKTYKDNAFLMHERRTASGIYNVTANLGRSLKVA